VAVEAREAEEREEQPPLPVTAVVERAVPPFGGLPRSKFPPIYRLASRSVPAEAARALAVQVVATELLAELVVCQKL
jgi:hypothetical protein